jgi:hypothetical protein
MYCTVRLDRITVPFDRRGGIVVARGGPAQLVKCQSSTMPIQCACATDAWVAEGKIETG